MQTDHTKLLSGQNSAQQQVLIDSTELAKIQAQINGIQDKIHSDSQKAMYSEIGLGVAIFVMVVGIAFAVATGGPRLRWSSPGSACWGSAGPSRAP